MLANLIPTPAERLETPPRTPAPAEGPRPPEDTRFAQMLRERRAAASGADERETQHRGPTSDDARPPPAAKGAPAGARRDAPAALERAADRLTIDAGAPPPSLEATPTLEPAVAEPGEHASTDAPGAVASQAETILPAMGWPTAAAAPAIASSAAPGTEPPAPGLASARRGRGAAGAITEGSDKDRAAATGAARDSGAQNPAASIAQAEVPADTLAVAAAPREAPPPSAPGVMPAPARALTHAAPPAAALPTPVASPNFGETLAAQVSIFARDGVQQAELRLNPPEMGPIGVQIDVVGNDARIHFHAAQAATREIIERALPELAGALRSEGLTLTGGGVSDRPADARDGAYPQAREGAQQQHGAGAGFAPAAAPRARPTPQGALDVYA